MYIYTQRNKKIREYIIKIAMIATGATGLVTVSCVGDQSCVDATIDAQGLDLFDIQCQGKYFFVSICV